MNYKYSYLDKIYSIDLKKDKDACVAVIDGKEYGISDCSIEEGIITFDTAGQRIHLYVAAGSDRVYVSVNGECYVFEPVVGQAQKVRASFEVKGNSVSSPMPGLLVKVPVQIGDLVRKNSILAIVEAMKMQNELRSPCDGKVVKINYQEGNQVDALKPIVEVERVPGK